MYLAGLFLQIFSVPFRKLAERLSPRTSPVYPRGGFATKNKSPLDLQEAPFREPPKCTHHPTFVGKFVAKKNHLFVNLLKDSFREFALRIRLCLMLQVFCKYFASSLQVVCK